MPLDRRSLLKKGALAGLLTAGAAALGVANAPAASAGYWRNLLWSKINCDTWRACVPWSSVIRPHTCLINEGLVFTSVWGKDAIDSEGDLGKIWLWADGDTGMYPSWPPFRSTYYEDGGNDAVVLLQVALNAWREMGYGSGSMLSADGVIGPASDARIKSFQSWWGTTVDGLVGPATWTALMDTVY